MNINKLILIAACLVGLATFQTANAVPVGVDRLLGTIVPSHPACVANEIIQVNGLLEGWTYNNTVVLGYNDTGAHIGLMGDNPSDGQAEVYTLLRTTLPGLTGNAPAAVTGDKHDTPGAGASYTINLANYSYDWVLAKWGANAEIYYIGGLTGEITLTVKNTWPASNNSANGNGLSHYTLFNGHQVPDGGTTMALMGLGFAAMGLIRRKIS